MTKNNDKKKSCEEDKERLNCSKTMLVVSWMLLDNDN